MRPKLKYSKIQVFTYVHVIECKQNPPYLPSFLQGFLFSIYFSLVSFILVLKFLFAADSSSYTLFTPHPPHTPHTPHTPHRSTIGLLRANGEGGFNRVAMATKTDQRAAPPLLQAEVVVQVRNYGVISFLFFLYLFFYILY